MFIEKLKSIIKSSKFLNRKIIFAGRSLQKYPNAAKNAKIIDFKKEGVIICKDARETRAWLEKASKNKEEYIIVCTDHQGEENAILSRMASGELKYELDEKDLVVFSSEVIPTKITIENSLILQDKLELTHCKVIRDIHVSGHASQQDHDEMIKMLKPEIIIPSHGHVALKHGAIEIATKNEYVENKNLLLLEDQKIIKIC